MKEYLLMKILGLIIKQIAKDAPDKLREFADAILDYIEAHVLGTASKVDDMIILPLCEMFRTTFNIPDDD